ncbi:hypothetical protein D3C76_1520070 [compost metagenome]
MAGKSVFEDLLEAEEFDNTSINGWVKTKSTFVRSNGTAELYTISTVNSDLALIICPRNTEHNQTFWLNQSFQNGIFLILRFSSQDWKQRFKDFLYSLMEFGLERITRNNLCVYVFDITMCLVAVCV